MGSVQEVGSFILDPLGFGVGDKVFGVKDDKKAPVPQAAKAVTPDSPTGPQADVNKKIVQQQGEDRRRRLLFESTGRTPQGPSITTAGNTGRTLL